MGRGRRVVLRALAVRGDVEVAQGEAHDVLESRGGDDLAEEVLLRLVYQYQGDVLGVPAGAKPIKEVTYSSP